MTTAVHEEWWRPAPGPEGPVPDATTGSSASSGPFVGVLSLLFIMVLSPQSFLPLLAPLRIALLAAGVTALAYVRHRFTHPGGPPIWSRGTLLAAGLFLWALGGAFFSYWPGGTVGFLSGTYIKTLALFFLLSQIVDSTARLRATAWAMSLMTVPLAWTAIHHFLSSGAAGPSSRIVGYEAPLTENPNDLALMLNLVLPLLGALLLIHPKPAVRAALVGIALLDMAAIVCSFSRGGFLTLVAISLIGGVKILTHHKERGLLLLGVGVLVAALPFLPSGYLDRLWTIADMHEDKTGSAQTRWADSLVAMRLISENPLIGAGAGVGALALNAERGATWTDVHNVYLELGVELGLPGLALFLALYGTCLSLARRARTEASEKGRFELACLAEGVEISLWGFGVAAFFHPVAYQFYFYWLAGLALALRFERGTAAEVTPWWAGAPGTVHA
jgi:O-antigen ligase